MVPEDHVDSGEDSGESSSTEKMEAIAARLDRPVRSLLAEYVNEDGWLDEGKPHTEESFRLTRATVGRGHLVSIQWGYRRREEPYPSYPEVSLHRRGDEDVVLRLWAPAGAAHPNRARLGETLHAATGMRVEMYGDFVLSKDPDRLEAWRGYRTCDTQIPG